MSGRLLDFKQYIGGADNVINLEMFPSQTKTYTYDFVQNITNFTFNMDYQSLLLDTVTYDRTTGLPNFSETNVLGYFDNYTNLTSAGTMSDHYSIISAPDGEITITLPKDRYTGAIFPSARQNVVATIVSFEWSSPGATTVTEKNLHRFLILERWEPGVEAGDPSQETSPQFTAITLSVTE